MPAPTTIEPVDFVFKTTPYEHQLHAFNLSRDKINFALLMDMGTGKTKVTLDTGAYLYDRDIIDCLIVAAPKGVHRNWIVKEVPVHVPDWTNYRAAVWSSNMLVAERKAVEHVLDPAHKGFRIIAVNLEAFKDSTRCKAAKFLRPILNSLRCMMVIDESSKIKTPGAKRTMAMNTLGKYAVAKRILTGTPVTQGPLDLFSQFGFLDRRILGFDNFTTFKHYFAEWEKEVDMRRHNEINRARYQRGQAPDPDAGQYETLTGYKNLDKMKALIAPHSFRITKEECVDLPEKVFVTRIVEMSPEQKKIYNKIVRESVIEIEEGQAMTVNHILTKLLRVQQVLGGFVPVEEFGDAEPIPGPNPRLESLVDLIHESDGKFIIWARFRAEIEAIRDRLNKEFGKGQAVCYYGDVKDADRQEAIDRFQGVRGSDEAIPPEQQARFFIGQQHSGGFGLTLTAASNVVYFSNDFSLEARLQSEDRAHRIGQTKHVTYVDMEVPKSIDSKIIKALRNKMSLADTITDDSKRKQELDFREVGQLFSTV